MTLQQRQERERGDHDKAPDHGMNLHACHATLQVAHTLHLIRMECKR